MFATFSLTLCDFNPSIKLTCLRAQHLPRWVQADTVLSFVKNPYFALPARVRGRLPTGAVIRNGCVSSYHQTCTDAIIAASVCQKKLGCLQLFSAAGRKQSQVKYKHKVTCEMHGKSTGVCVHTQIKRLPKEQAENVFAGRKYDPRGRTYGSRGQGECLQGRGDGSSLSVPAHVRVRPLQHFWVWAG